MPYKFLEGLTMADVAFQATGRTLEEMFASAADAMMSTQVHDLKTVGTAMEKSFEIESADIERLLHDFLQELIYLKDAELMLFREYELAIKKTGKGYLLSAKAKGSKLDNKKQELLVDVKAVSWHKFKVEKTKAGWKAIVILDV